MKYIKKFESKKYRKSIKRYTQDIRDMKNDIDDIFVYLLEDYSELNFKFTNTSRNSYIVYNVSELGEYESKNYLHRMTDELETIKDRLSDIGISCNWILDKRRIVITLVLS